MKIQYALHPGWMMSKRDRQMHYIGIRDLIRLYKIDPSNYIVWDDQELETFLGRKWQDYRHLFPNFSGNYIVEERVEISSLFTC